MAFLDLKSSNLLLGVNDNIITYNLIDENFTIYKLPNTVVSSSKTETKFVSLIALSENSKKIAVVTNTKHLLTYDKSGSAYNLMCTQVLPRAASSIYFSKHADKLIIADKSGDVFISGEETLWAPRLILGHLSMVLDALITPDDKYIISCDRDEKIRISSYPDTFNIISYCLGHEEFVSALKLLMKYPNVLFSTSGDATFRAWHYMSGTELLHVKLPKPATAMKVTSLCEKIHAAISFHESKDVNIYEITINENNCMQCDILQVINLPGSLVSFSMSTHVIWFSINGCLLEYVSDPCKNFYKKSGRILKEAILDLISVDSSNRDDFISSLFKKHYPNIEDYQKKKQKRLCKDSHVGTDEDTSNIL